MAEIITPDAVHRGGGPGLSYRLGSKIFNQALMMPSDLLGQLTAAIRSKDFDADVAVQFGGAEMSRFAGSRGRNGYNVTDDGIAIVQVSGLLLDRGSTLEGWGWITTYEALAEQFRRLIKDDAVKQVILDIDSGGGMASGCFDLCAGELVDLKRKKRVTAIAQNMAYSAAYAIASTAHELYVTKLGGAGSIGVISTHMSYEQYLEKAGIAPTIIHAGRHKADGNPYQALSHGARAEMAASIDQIHDVFVRHVARHRNLEEDAVRGMEARCYQGQKAVDAKLADGVLTFDGLLQKIRKGAGQSGKTKPAKGRAMSDDSPAAARPDYDAMITAAMATIAANSRPQAPAPVAAPAAQPSASVEVDAQTRIFAILDSDEGKSRPTLARTLAKNAKLSVDEAKAIMAATPVEAGAPAAAATTTQAGVADALAAAMKAPGASAGIKPEASAPGASGAKKGFADLCAETASKKRT